MYDEYKDDNNVQHEEEAEVYEALDVFDNYKHELKKRQDNFLDSYYFYLKNKNKEHKSILERKKIELELLDPSFNFEID